MKKFTLILVASLALAACNEEDNTKSVQAAEDIQVSAIADTAWPPSQEVTDSVATDPLMANNMIVLDMSGSMGDSGCSGSYPNRAEAARDALMTWIGTRTGENIGLVSFSRKGLELDAGLGQGDGHIQRVVTTIADLTADSGTPLKSAMTLAQTELEKQAIRQGGSGTYRMIVITDGEANGGEDPRPVVRSIVENPANMIEIHTIGFCIQGGHSLNDPSRVFYIDANSPEDIVRGLEETGETTTFTDIDFEELSQ